MLTFKGSMQAPLYEHGTQVYYLRQIGTVHHRKWREGIKEWDYGLLFDGALGNTGIQWMSEYMVGNCCSTIRELIMQDYFKLVEAQETIKQLRMTLTQQQNLIRQALIALDEDDWDDVGECLRSILPDDEYSSVYFVT